MKKRYLIIIIPIILLLLKICQDKLSSYSTKEKPLESGYICDSLINGIIIEDLHFKVSGFQLNNKDSSRFFVRICDDLYTSKSINENENIFVIGDSIYKNRNSNILYIYRKNVLIKKIKINCKKVDFSNPYN